MKRPRPQLAPPAAPPSVIVFGPQGCGKTRHAKQIAAHFSLEFVKDDATWPASKAAWASFEASTNTLWLVSDERVPSISAFRPTSRWIFTFDEVMAKIRALPTDFNASGSKYLREMRGLVDGKTDVYAVLVAFNVTCPARQHAIKKLLCAGLRDKGDAVQDLSEARDAVARALQLELDRA